jgi:hypothetical protein
MTGKTLALATMVIASVAPTILAALSPPLPCEGVYESNMGVASPVPLGGWPQGDAAIGSGVTVETYYNRSVVAGDTYQDLQAPVPDLVEFSGTRLVHCASGTFFAINGQDAETVGTAIAATEFVRPLIQSGELVTVQALRRASTALYGSVIELRETEQTCGCAAYFDALKPAGQGPFHMRSDVDY